MTVSQNAGPTVKKMGQIAGKLRFYEVDLLLYITELT
jgi:hypothetical protein